MSNREIADELFISENTVKNHVRNILEKLHLHSRMEAVVYAVREKLLDIRCEGTFRFGRSGRWAWLARRGRGVEKLVPHSDKKVPNFWCGFAVFLSGLREKSTREGPEFGDSGSRWREGAPDVHRGSSIGSGS